MSDDEIEIIGNLRAEVERLRLPEVPPDDLIEAMMKAADHGDQFPPNYWGIRAAYVVVREWMEAQR